VETVSKDYLVDAGQGDRNTKFYHTCANQRSNINLISKISDELGVT
jgi:hypothetical protein